MILSSTSRCSSTSPSVAAGSSNSIVFSVDLTEVTDVNVKGYLEADGTVKIYLLADVEFEKWVASESFTALYESSELDTIEFLVPLTESGRYHVVVSNSHDTVNPKQVGAFVSLTYQEPSA